MVRPGRPPPVRLGRSLLLLCLLLGTAWGRGLRESRSGRRSPVQRPLEEYGVRLTPLRAAALRQGDDTLLLASAGNGEEKDKGKDDDDDEDKKTLSQQVAEGKYGLIQKELFSTLPRRPGVLSYKTNPEVPRDTAATLGGLDEDEIWLAEDHLLVLRGGAFRDKPGHGVGDTWPPIDDYQAPPRQVKLPAHPRVPPPFPVQLTDNGPTQFLTNANGTPAFSQGFLPLVPYNGTLLVPPFAFPQAGNFSSYPPQLPFPPPGPGPGGAPGPGGGFPFFLPPAGPNGTPLYPVPLPFPPPPNASFFQSLPPGAAFLPPPANLSEPFDEDDPSIYYPPPYDFYYDKDNSSVVPPGPLVPGIILPPPPDFFAPFEPSTTTRKPPIRTRRPPSKFRPSIPYPAHPENEVEPTPSTIAAESPNNGYDYRRPKQNAFQTVKLQQQVKVGVGSNFYDPSSDEVAITTTERTVLIGGKRPKESSTVRPQVVAVRKRVRPARPRPPEPVVHLTQPPPSPVEQSYYTNLVSPTPEPQPIFEYDFTSQRDAPAQSHLTHQPHHVTEVAIHSYREPEQALNGYRPQESTTESPIRVYQEQVTRTPLNAYQQPETVTQLPVRSFHTTPPARPVQTEQPITQIPIRSYQTEIPVTQAPIQTYHTDRPVNKIPLRTYQHPTQAPQYHTETVTQPPIQNYAVTKVPVRTYSSENSAITQVPIRAYQTEPPVTQLPIRVYQEERPVTQVPIRVYSAEHPVTKVPLRPYQVEHPVTQVPVHSYQAEQVPVRTYQAERPITPVPVRTLPQAEHPLNYHRETPVTPSPIHTFQHGTPAVYSNGGSYATVTPRPETVTPVPIRTFHQTKSSRVKINLYPTTTPAPPVRYYPNPPDDKATFYFYEEQAVPQNFRDSKNIGVSVTTSKPHLVYETTTVLPARPTLRTPHRPSQPGYYYHPANDTLEYYGYDTGASPAPEGVYFPPAYYAQSTPAPPRYVYVPEFHYQTTPKPSYFPAKSALQFFNGEAKPSAPSPKPPVYEFSFQAQAVREPSKLSYNPPRLQGGFKPSVPDYVSTTPAPTSAVYTTSNPIYYYTQQDDSVFDEITKKYFSMFGRKLPSDVDKSRITTPLPPVRSSPLPVPRPFQPETEGGFVPIHAGYPVSLADDTLVNYRRPLPPIEPEAELIHPPPPKPQGNAYISYQLPGNGGHFYFLTPQQPAYRRRSPRTSPHRDRERDRRKRGPKYEETLARPAHGQR